MMKMNQIGRRKNENEIDDENKIGSGTVGMKMNSDGTRRR
jgi:hypothetical protein